MGNLVMQNVDYGMIYVQRQDYLSRRPPSNEEDGGTENIIRTIMTENVKCSGARQDTITHHCRSEPFRFGLVYITVLKRICPTHFQALSCYTESNFILFSSLSRAPDHHTVLVQKCNDCGIRMTVHEMLTNGMYAESLTQVAYI